MVVKGLMSVGLIDAHTKKPFREHQGPGGRVYVEVEPDAEYFVAVSCLASSSSSGNQLLACKCIIDGQDMKCGQVIVPGNPPVQMGLLQRDSEGVQTTTCFRFEKPKTSHPKKENDTATKSSYAGMLFGSITIRFNQLTLDTTASAVNEEDQVLASQQITPQSVAANITASSKKVLRTGTGSISNCQHYGHGQKPKFIIGPVIDQFTFHYCTTPGLILAGILNQVPPTSTVEPTTNNDDGSTAPKFNPPPSSSSSTTMKRIKQEEPQPTGNEDLSKIKHKKIKTKGVLGDDGSVLIPGKEQDFFDLSDLADD